MIIITISDVAGGITATYIRKENEETGITLLRKGKFVS